MKEGQARVEFGESAKSDEDQGRPKLTVATGFGINVWRSKRHVGTGAN